MNFKSYSFADLKALTNEMKQRLDNPIYFAHKDSNINILSNATKEIDNRLNALISPQKQKSEKSTLPPDVINRFLMLFNGITGHSLRTVDDKTTRQLNKIILVDSYTLKDFERAVKNAFDDMTLRETVKHLTPEFITRPAQFLKYLNMKTTTTKNIISL